MSNDAHSQPPQKNQDLLYDPDVAALSHAERARTLADQIHVATLCTISAEEAAYPYGSFVTFAMDGDRPTFFISELAEHTRNLHKDTRASLMIAESGGPDPLANSRVTLLGHVRQVTEEGAREQAKAAYLETHPSAAHYIDYSDFSFWQLEVDSLRYIGGYGRMSWVQGEEWASSEADVVAEFAEGIIQHMNEDHQNAMVEYCQAFSKATDTSAATMTGVDRYGFEMSAETAAGPRPIRLAFSSPISSSEEARKEMVRLVREAREALTSSES